MLGRPPGFNWYFPGLYSAIVPYHDINDFYYSGHISTSGIFLCALYQLTVIHPDAKHFKYAFYFWIAFKIPYIWVMMTWTRTHYMIDLAGGLCFVPIVAIAAEKVGYLIEVLVMGVPARERKLLFFRPCPKCGWSNSYGTYFWLSNEEKKAQLSCYKERLADSSSV